MISYISKLNTGESYLYNISKYSNSNGAVIKTYNFLLELTPCVMQSCCPKICTSFLREIFYFNTITNFCACHCVSVIYKKMLLLLKKHPFL